MPELKIKHYIFDIAQKHQLLKKLNKQSLKFQQDILDKGLNFETIRTKSDLVFYSIRIDKARRAYLIKS